MRTLGEEESVRKTLQRIAAGIGAIVLVAAIIVGLQGPRSVATRVIFQILLAGRGFTFDARDITIGTTSAKIDGVVINETSGAPVFSAQSITASYDWGGPFGRTDRAYGLRSVVFTKPRLDFVRKADGTFNLSKAFGPAAAPPGGTSYYGPPLHAIFTVRGGEVRFSDPGSTNPRGQHFGVTRIDARFDIARGSTSRGGLTGTYEPYGAGNVTNATPLTATMYENDSLQYALATLNARNLDFAPIVDGFAPTRSFEVNAGTADVTLRAFDAGYDPVAGPQWRLNGEGILRGARITVVPLAVPLRDINGRMRFDGGWLTFDQTSGSAAGIPIALGGGVRLLGGISISLGASFQDDATRVRRLFSFARSLPVGGDFKAAAFIAGPPSDIHVRAAIRAPMWASYQNLVVNDLSSDLFYAGGHVTLDRIDARYDGSSIYGDADIAVSQNGSPTQLAVIGRVPAAGLPYVGNVNASGSAAAIASFNGPLAHLSGEGFARVTGGNGVAIRASVSAGPERFSAGVLMSAPDGGDLMLEAGVDRPQDAPRTIEGVALAHGVALDLQQGSYALPGVVESAALPAVSGTFNGAAWIGGTQSSPTVGIDLHATRLVIAGDRLGDGNAIASGAGGTIRVERLSFDGPDATFDASGYAAAAPSAGRYALALSGVGNSDIATLPGLPPSLRARGRSAARFSGVYVAGRWTVSGDASSANASLAGVPVRSLDATLSGGLGLPTQVYAATASAAGGAIAATGTLPHPRNASDTLLVWADDIDLKQLTSLGVPLTAGLATAFAQVGGTVSGPTASAQATVSGGLFKAVPVSGDIDVGYGGGVLTARAGRVAYAGNRVNVSGSIADLNGTSPLADAPINIRARMRLGNLGELLNGYLPSVTTLEGTVHGGMRLRGTLRAPTVDGVINSDGGTIRGVAFKSFHGVVHLAHGALALQNGRVLFGSSSISVAGSLTPDSVHVRSASPHVDLSDFNDFFDGYDTLDGVGSWNIGFNSSPSHISADGNMDFTGTALAGYPLGTVDATFASTGSALLASFHQRGPADDAFVSGSATFTSTKGGLPDFRGALFDVRGSATGVDLGIVMPLIRHENLGLTGTLDIAGRLRGRLSHPLAFATFALHDGHLGKLSIDALSGSLETDGRSIGLTDAKLQLPFAQAAGSAQLGPGDRIVGSIGVDAQDLAKVASTFGRPGIVEGAAKMSINVGGSYRDPRVQANVDGGAGSLLGVRYDNVTVNVNLQPGELDVSNARLALAESRGALTLQGTLPLQLKPLALGPKNKPIDLRFTADHVDLAAFTPLLSPYANLSGIVQATASASGRAGNPVLGGSATLRNAAVHSTFETVPLSGVTADLALQQDTVTLSRFRGSLGSGDVVGEASAHVVPAVGLRSNAGLQYSGRVAFNSANVDIPGWISGTLNGNFSLTKAGVNPYLTGTIAASDALVPFSAIYTLATAYGQGSAAVSAPGPVPGVPSPLPGRTVAYAGSIYGGGFHLVTSAAPATPKPSVLALPAMHLDVTAQAGKRVQVKGGAIDLTTTGALKIGGRLSAPTLDGSFSSTRGQVTYFDTVFRIDRGSVVFDSTQGLLPSLDVRATTDTGGAQITLAISGRVDRLNTDMSSVPSMTRDQIAATLLHAPVVSELTNSTPAQAQSILTGEAQAFFNAQLSRSLLFPLESYLAESLDVEQINFIFDQNGQPAIEVRKLFTPTIYGIYQSTIKVPVSQSFGVAYVLRDTTSLELLQTQSPDGISLFTMNLQFTFR